MKQSLSIALLFALFVGLAGAATKTREHKIALTENREVIVKVPDGFSLETGQGDGGLVGLKLSDAKQSVTIDVQFLPDGEGKFAAARARVELIHEMFVDYVSSSTEQAMQFEELDPQVGAGTYCVFTDAKLVGKTELPPGEYLHLTSGVKAWPGVVAIFRCFSNDTKSEGYQALLTMLRESVHEKPVPLK
jgi:hypothetical protein